MIFLAFTDIQMVTCPNEWFSLQSHKDLPAFLLVAPSLSLSLVLGSFGESTASIVPIGNVKPSLDPTAKALLVKQKQKDIGEGTIVYKAKDEIRHIFRVDPQSPPKIITLVFLLSVLAGLGGLFVVVSFPLAHYEASGPRLMSVIVVPNSWREPVSPPQSPQSCPVFPSALLR